MNVVDPRFPHAEELPSFATTPPYFRYYIICDVVTRQKGVLERELQHIERDLNPNSSAYQWKMRDEVKTLYEQARLRERTFKTIPHREERVLDKWILAIYKWAMKDRLKGEE